MKHKISFIVFLVWLFFQVASYFYGYYLHREMWQCEFRLYTKVLEELKASGVDNPKEELSRTPDTFLSRRQAECKITKDNYVLTFSGKVQSKDYGYHLLKFPLFILGFAFIIFIFEIIFKNFLIFKK